MLGTSIDSVLPWLARARLLGGPARNSRPDIHFEELPNTYVRYRLRSREFRPTLAMIPDPPVVLEHYNRLLVHYPDELGILVFEAPGCGFSVPKPGFDFRFDEWVETIANFLLRLDRGPYVLAFPCLSGFAAIAIANKHPRLVSGLIGIQTASWAAQRRWVLSRSKYGILTVPIYGQLLLLALKRRRAARLFPAIARKRIEEFAATADWSLEHGALFPFATAAQSYITDRPPALVRPVSQPTTAVWGDADPSHAALATDRGSIQTLLPDTEIRRLSGCGHFPELEDCEAFGRIAASFVRSMSARHGTSRV